MSTGILSARVRQGIALMDLHHGAGWVWKVDPDVLDMRSKCGCVVGQATGWRFAREPDLRDAAWPYERGRAAMSLDEDGATAAGFQLPDDGHHDPRGYDALTRIWAFAIRRLREQRPQAVAS